MLKQGFNARVCLGGVRRIHGSRVSLRTRAAENQEKSVADLPQTLPKPVKWHPASLALANKETLAGTALSSTLFAAGFMGSGYNVEGPTSSIQAVLVLCLIVAVHEAGHFFAARLQGIHVSQFSIGMGPAIWSYKDAEVEYSIRALPLGGYVAFPDDDPDSKFTPEDPNLLKNRPIPDRALVISAGVIANIIFAYTILFAEVTTVGMADFKYKEGVRVPVVMVDSPAQRAGIQAKDIILEIGGEPVRADGEAVTRVVNKIKDSANRELKLKIRRDESVLDLTVLPTDNGDGGRIGVQLGPNADYGHKFASSPQEAATMAASEFKRLLGQVTGGLSQILSNFSKTAENLSGPVAIVAVGSEAARTDVTGLFQFGAIVNLNLAVVNLLPLPALDGGYLFLIAIEALRGGKKLPEGIEKGIMTSGFLALMVMGFGLIIKDTISLSGIKL